MKSFDYYRPKQEFFRTCEYRCEYVRILDAFYNGDAFKTWRYTIQRQNGEVLAQVDESELTRFCL